MNKDIFNTKYIKDLTENIQNEINNNGLRKESLQLLELFKIKEKLTINEIIVGFFRKFKVEKSRNWIIYSIYRFKKKGIIREIDGKKGIKVYKLK